MLPVVEFDGEATDQRKNRVVKWEETKVCAALAQQEQHKRFMDLVKARKTWEYNGLSA